jgi:phosphohistidine phosphatase SixA
MKLNIKQVSIGILIGICLIVALQMFYYYLKTHASFKMVVFNKEFSVDPYDSDLLWAQKIVKGGYFLHFRHGNRKRYISTPVTPETDVTGFDGISLVLNLDEKNHSFGSLTCLTEDGINEAKLVGTVFNYLNLKVSKVFTSPSCRARQTSYIAFGTEGEILNSLLHRTAMPRDMWKDASMNLKKKMLAENIPSGHNVILSGHNGTLDATLIDINEAGDYNRRDDVGFTVIEKVEDKLIARHTFKRFRDFSTIVIRPQLN